MKRLLPVLMVFGVFLGSAGESFALPPCPGSPASSRSTIASWTDCFGSLTGSGGKYVGEWKDGNPNGQGTETYAKSGNKYVGEFKDGKRHGHGTATYAGGNKYVGEYKDGKKNGQGTFTFGPNSKWAGDKYVGEFKVGKRHRQGTYTSANGTKYVGEWKDDKSHGQGTYTYADGRKYVGELKDDKQHGQGIRYNVDGTVYQEGIFENNKFKYAQKVTPTVIAKKSPEPSNEVQKENERLRKEIARLKEEKKQKPKPKKVAKNKPEPQQIPKSSVASGGSGFFISKTGQVVTNAHVVNGCKRITVGDSVHTQAKAQLIASDRRNDLALIALSSLQMASPEMKTLIQKLSVKVVPLASDGLLRSNDARLGELVLVSGYPYGASVSSAIKVSRGIVSSIVGMGDDAGQFQIDAAVQPGNSGGPIYDMTGNILGIVVAQLNKFAIAKATGSIPENVNFGIKSSTLRQFLTSKGVPTKWSTRTKAMSPEKLAEIAQKQTVMVMCHR